jgi:hypothetical protein
MLAFLVGKNFQVPHFRCLQLCNVFGRFFVYNLIDNFYYQDATTIIPVSIVLYV